MVLSNTLRAIVYIFILRNNCQTVVNLQWSTERQWLAHESHRKSQMIVFKQSFCGPNSTPSLRNPAMRGELSTPETKQISSKDYYKIMNPYTFQSCSQISGVVRL